MAPSMIETSRSTTITSIFLSTFLLLIFKPTKALNVLPINNSNSSSNLTDFTLDGVFLQNTTDIFKNFSLILHPNTFKYSTPVVIVLVFILMIVIIGTILGNILVCVAVCLVKKLRRPSNYLIVSLAVSDLCVAILVMPISMLYEILGKWPFGPVLCDFWVSFDVLSCTASILNLCMISVDRYYAITKPLEYGVKRTPRRMLFCVLLVWTAAAFISLPPVLILGNEKTESSCVVCQKFGYQIYATLGSFYIPLTVMMIVYFKIFSAARKIVREEKRAQSHLESHCYLEINVKNGNSAESRLLTNPDQERVPPRGSTASTNTTCSVDKTESSVQCFSASGRKSNESQYPMLATQKTPKKQNQTVPKSQILTSNAEQMKRRRNSSEVSHISHANRIRHSLSSFAKGSLLHSTHSPHQKKLRFQLAKERKASTTLGIIMSAFIICWLPFMTLALIKPFMNDNQVKDIVGGLFLWLGYANSLLNPIIYATLNRDFRRPFQEILFFRCSNLNSMMREEFYQTQYGDPDQHYCAANHGIKAQNYEEGLEIITTVEREDMKASESFL